MTAKQKCLLDLYKEFSVFCSENNIQYYCAAGTVLGAVRHEGFIPWDDDIDIIMTRSEFRKFIRAMDNNGPANRTLSFYEKNRDHHSTVARFIKEDSTMFCHYHMTGYSPAGILIDIFVLDFIPDGHDAQLEYISKLFVYSDLIMPTLSHSNRSPEKYLHLIDYYEKRVAECGLNSVTDELSKELSSYDEKQCNNYVLSWGSLPFIYPKELFGTPFYMNFEDVVIPVPEKWASYLTIHFGTKWCDVPYQDKRPHHNSIYNANYNYQGIYNLRDSLYNQNELLALYQSLKESRRSSTLLRRPIERFAANIHIRLCEVELNNNLKETGYKTATDIFNSGLYDSLIEVYAPYISLQTSPIFMGSLRHGSYTNWISPIIVPIDSSDLILLLQSLMYSGKMRIAEKLIGIYERAGILTQKLLSIKKLIVDFTELSGEYYINQYDDVLDKLSNIPEFSKIPEFIDLYWLSKVHGTLCREEEKQLHELASLSDSSPSIKKAFADYLWCHGQEERAKKIYEEVLSSSRNGMFFKDIEKKGIESKLDDIETPLESKYDSIFIHRLKLAEEIATACNDIGIELIVLSSDTDFELGIKANDSSKISNYIKSMNSENRELLSWEYGSNIKDLCLKYIDTSTSLIKVLQPQSEVNRYIGITIRLLRDKASKPYSSIIRLHEAIVNATTYDISNIKQKPNFFRRYFFRKIANAPELHKQKWRSDTYNAIVRRYNRKNRNPIAYSYLVSGNRILPKQVDLPSSVFSDYAASDYLKRYRNDLLFEKIKTMEPVLFTICSDSVSLSEIIKSEDITTLNSLPINDYKACHKETIKYEKKVKFVWYNLIDTAESLLLKSK